ncbi:MAG: molybdopterin-dependent oxidoreductase [Terriglobia bacterium]
MGVAAALHPSRLIAAHHQLSADPLVVECDFDGQIQPVTPFEDFMIYDHFSLPVLPPPAQLRIDGEVGQPGEIGIERLTTLPTARVTAVLESAGNGAGPRGLMSNGVWEGWRLADVLRMAQPGSGAAWVNLYGAEGYARSVPLDRVIRSGLLADRLNGRLLDKTHGMPYRAAFPGWYGMDWVKWLSRIEVAREPLASAGSDYLELLRGPGGKTIRRQLPPVQAKSIIVSPQKGATLNVGKVELSGVAWSGHGISKVEVSSDAGSTWNEAQLDAGEIYSWRIWRAEMTLREQGLVTFACRARDSQGISQPASRDPARLDYFALNEIQRMSCLVV